MNEESYDPNHLYLCMRNTIGIACNKFPITKQTIWEKQYTDEKTGIVEIQEIIVFKGVARRSSTQCRVWENELTMNFRPLTPVEVIQYSLMNPHGWENFRIQETCPRCDEYFEKFEWIVEFGKKKYHEECFLEKAIAEYGAKSRQMGFNGKTKEEE